MDRSRARAAQGRRAEAAVPDSRWQVTTVVAAVRRSGVAAVGTMPHALDGDSFVAYVRQGLIPSLRRGDVLVMDNLSSHKVKGVRQSLEEAGIDLLYLPPYSPDMSPIENCFSPFKAFLRRAAARTAEALGTAIQTAFGHIHNQDLTNYFHHCGYG